MCNENNIPLKVWFNLKNLSTDVITKVNDIDVDSLTGGELVDANPGQFWIEPDTNGNDTLCATKVIGQPLTLSALNGVTPYNVSAQDFILIGGHPPTPPGK